MDYQDAAPSGGARRPEMDVREGGFRAALTVSGFLMSYLASLSGFLSPLPCSLGILNRAGSQLREAVMTSRHWFQIR